MQVDFRKIRLWINYKATKSNTLSYVWLREISLTAHVVYGMGQEVLF